MHYFKKIIIKILFLGVFLFATPTAFAGISFTSNTFSAQEDSGSIIVSVDLSANCFGECYDTVTVDYTVSAGTASNADFTPVSGQLSWSADGTESFQISIIPDSDVEGDETIVVTLNNCQEFFSSSSSSCDSNEFGVFPISANAVIINDDDFNPGNISLDSSSSTVVEGQTTTVSATRSGGADGQVSINFSTSDNTAVSGSDYISASGSLSWANGESGSKTIDLSTLTDFIDENNEVFTLSLSNPSGGALLGSTSSSTITIENLASAGEINLDANSYSITEGARVTATIIRSNGSSGSVSVNFATVNNSAVAGEDYTATSGTLSWADGESGGKTVVISTLKDFVEESEENFTLTLSNLSGDALLGTLNSANISIQNVAAPGSISFDNKSLTVQEGGQVTATITRSNGSSGAVSIDYTTGNNSAVAGVDYTAVSGTLTWADGESGSKPIVITTLSDGAVESEESFTVTLSNLVGDAELGLESTATVAIINSTQALSDLDDLTQDQLAVAKALDDLCADASGDLRQRCEEIFNSDLSSDQLKEAIDSIKPAQISAQGSIAVDFGFQQLQVLHGRIVSLRNKDNSDKISLAGFTMHSFGQQVPLGKIAQSLIYNTLEAAGDDEPLRDSPLGFFIKGQINIGDKDSTGSEKGFDINTKSITLGLDYQFTDELVLGVASGYGHSDTDFDKNGGEMVTHSGNFSIYGSYFLPQDFYIDWVLSYAINDYENSRIISYTGFQSSATSNPFGDQYGGSLGFGKDFYIQSVFFSPYARIEYLRTGIDEYSEQGGGGLALKIAEQSIFSLASTLGGQIGHSVSMPWGVISPGMRFEWRHQFRDDQRTIQSQFTDAQPGTGSFSITTDEPDRDYFNLGASLVVTLAEGRSAFLRYETRLGQNDISNHTIEAAVRIPF